MQKEATPVIVAEDSFMKTIPARSSMVVGGVGELCLFPPLYVFVKGFSTSSWLAIKTHFIHLCIFIYDDHVTALTNF